MAKVLSNLAGSMAARDELQRAARLLSASETALEWMGTRYQPSDQPEFDHILAVVQVKLDDAPFESAWAAGRAMTLDAAFEAVLTS